MLRVACCGWRAYGERCRPAGAGSAKRAPPARLLLYPCPPHAPLPTPTPLQIEDLLTSYWRQHEAVAHAPGAIMPYLKDAVDRMNCHTSMPEATAQRWVDYCAAPHIGKSFLAVDCAAEICAVLKHRSPGPVGPTY